MNTFLPVLVRHVLRNYIKLKAPLLLFCFASDGGTDTLELRTKWMKTYPSFSE